jgi:hypothetical protein
VQKYKLFLKQKNKIIFILLFTLVFLAIFTTFAGEIKIKNGKRIQIDRQNVHGTGTCAGERVDPTWGQQRANR